MAFNLSVPCGCFEQADNNMQDEDFMNRTSSVLFGKLKMRTLFALVLALYSSCLLSQPSIDLSQSEQQSVSPLLTGLLPVTEAMLAAPPSEDWLI